VRVEWYCKIVLQGSRSECCVEAESVREMKRCKFEGGKVNDCEMIYLDEPPLSMDL